MGISLHLVFLRSPASEAPSSVLALDARDEALFSRIRKYAAPHPAGVTLPGEDETTHHDPYGVPLTTIDVYQLFRALDMSDECSAGWDGAVKDFVSRRPPSERVLLLWV